MSVNMADHTSPDTDVFSGPDAIACYNISKHYGRGKNKLQVLQNLEMKVPTGKIYGLLGPSGCGKTTLLRCCLGQLKLDTGLVLTLGRPPLTPGHGVPGSRVGYMPQDLALYNEFTVKEMLIYFGTFHKMSTKSALERIDFLLDLLNLPHKNQMVGYLSGGQKRRVSFAIALIQSPELLILDEPTVGVDPILRQKIWDYLIGFARTGNTTIILTTHYIEEARNAHTVGLMRHGVLLAEESPQVLIARHNFPTLEEVFLKLCMVDKDEDEEDEDYKNANNSLQVGVPDEKTHLLTASHGDHSANSYTNDMVRNSEGAGYQELTPSAVKTPVIHYDKPKVKFWDMLPSLMNMSALLVKDLLKLARNPGLTIFQFILPLVEMSLFYLAIGGMPMNLPVGIANHEGHCPYPLEFPLRMSCIFLEQLDKSMINQVNVNSTTDAIDDLKAGNYFGVIDIPQNFTFELIKRVEQGSKVDNATLEGSTIKVTLDATSAQIAISLQTGILTSYEAFMTEVLTKSGMNPETAQIPVSFEEPVYGELNAPLTYFMAAGVILTLIFFHAVALTAMSFVIERKEGLLDRIWVAGVGPVEVSLAHLLTQLIIISVQITIVMVFTFVIFKVPIKGNPFLVVLMMALQGLCGMALGLLISAICDSESTAIQLSIGTFYPIMLLSGIIWPIEAMPKALMYLAKIFPQTLAADSIRAILSRGWGMAYFDVWIGFFSVTLWWLTLFGLASLVLRLRR